MTLYQQLHDRNQLLEVDMDDVKVYLLESDKRAIGTRGLNGCTCVVVLGKTAILMAHISPYPGRFDADTEEDITSTSHSHHETFLNRIESMINEEASKFPPNSTAWGIFSYAKGDSRSAGYMKPVVSLVQSRLHRLGYTMRPEFYEEMEVQDIVPPKGELVAFFNRQQVAELYLERRRLWPKQQDSSNTMPVTGSASSAMISIQPPVSSYWAWSGRVQRWAFIVQGQGQPPQAEWPRRQGITNVWCTDENLWRRFDHDANKWE